MSQKQSKKIMKESGVAKNTYSQNLNHYYMACQHLHLRSASCRKKMTA